MGDSIGESDVGRYSVPEEAEKLFRDEILHNPLISKYLPPEAEACGQFIRFEGSTSPSIPINWRFAESISALKALEGTYINLLLRRKYAVAPQEIVINTDHAQLFIMSTLLWTIDPAGDALTGASIASPDASEKLHKYFPNWDKHRSHGTYHRQACTNIYKTKDDRFFHLHGSMNPDPSLDSIGLPHDIDAARMEDSWKPFVEKMSHITSNDMQYIASDKYRQAGTICWTKEEYRKSEHGQANSHVGLFELHAHYTSDQKACWWPPSPQTSALRPLAGLKVIDLTRVIAAPAITRGLAELGASVMRITAPHLTDISALHIDLNWGKWNACLDFRDAEDRAKMRSLIMEADVVVVGYRPGVLDKWGLAPENILELCKDRDRGIIVARENCYGWNGPWSYRSGWQQISDACCGVSIEFGRAMGNDEPVTPVFPNSDYCTGVAGCTGIIAALLKRAEDGGSYIVDVALNYYSQWLVNSCGVYPPEVWTKLWATNGNEVFRHFHSMQYTIPALMKMLKQNSAGKIFRKDFFEDRDCKSIGKTIRTVKPILSFPANNVQLGYNVGTRSNGVDQPRWPKDLMSEIVI